MKFEYTAFDGKGFSGPDALFPDPKLMQFILQYGPDALEAMDKIDGDQEQQYLQQLMDAGLLEKVEGENGGKIRLTPRMVRGLQHKALLDIFQEMQRGSKEGHVSELPGRSAERTEGTKRYEFGDPLSEVELASTMRNALARKMASRHGDEASGPAGLPLKIGVDDFELNLTEGSGDCATVVLIDQSGSMMRWGRFYHAKRVALGMAELIRSRFAQDTLDFVGFYSLAQRIAERDLPLVMPKPVSVYDHQVRIRMPLAQARGEPGLPQHFTNLQMGLRLARRILGRRGAANKQIFVITDGQPTAHIESGIEDSQEMLYLLYPPSERTAQTTLREALRCQQQGIRLATFALVEDYWGMDWVGFVEQMTRLTHGMAYYCSGESLSSTVIESYLTGRKKKSFIH